MVNLVDCRLSTLDIGILSSYLYAQQRIWHKQHDEICCERRREGPLGPLTSRLLVAPPTQLRSSDRTQVQLPELSVSLPSHISAAHAEDRGHSFVTPSPRPRPLLRGVAGRVFRADGRCVNIFDGG